MNTRGIFSLVFAMAVVTLVSALVLALVSAPAMAVTKDCFTITSTDWKICDAEGKKQGLVMTLANACVETMQLKLCLEKEDGSWDCKWYENIKEGESVEAESCDNTGAYKISACEDKSDCDE